MMPDTLYERLARPEQPNMTTRIDFWGVRTYLLDTARQLDAGPWLCGLTTLCGHAEHTHMHGSQRRWHQIWFAADVKSPASGSAVSDV